MAIKLSNFTVCTTHYLPDMTAELESDMTSAAEGKISHVMALLRTQELACRHDRYANIDHKEDPTGASLPMRSRRRKGGNPCAAKTGC